MIDTYVRDFSRWTVGPREHRETLMRELQAHLREAEEACQLEETLEGLPGPHGRSLATAAAGGRTRRAW